MTRFHAEKQLRLDNAQKNISGDGWCTVQTTVRPVSATLRMTRMTTAAEYASRPVVGSSAQSVCQCRGESSVHLPRVRPRPRPRELTEKDDGWVGAELDAYRETLELRGGQA